MAKHLGMCRPPAAGMHHRELVPLLDEAPARRAAKFRRLRFVLLPFEMHPLDFGEGAALGAWRLKNALIRRGVSLQHVGGFGVDRRRADADFPIREGRGALLGQFDRIALDGLLARIRLVDKEQAAGVPSQVSRRAAGDDLKRSPGEATR